MALLLYGRAFSVGFLSKGPGLQDNGRAVTAQGPGAGPAHSFVCSRVFWRLRFGSTLDPRALMLKERRKDSLALAGGGGVGGGGGRGGLSGPLSGRCTY